jgi:hypothetical protein
MFLPGPRSFWACHRVLTEEGLSAARIRNAAEKPSLTRRLRGMMRTVSSVGVGRAVDLCNASSSRTLRAEPLEGRWLLSATGAREDSIPTPSPEPDVQVIELQKIVPGEDDDAVEIAPSQLPPAVLRGVDKGFDDARIISASVSADEDGVEYDVVMTFQRQTIDATLSPDGRVLEHEVAMPTRDVPQAVIDELLSRVGDPNATIQSATKVFRDGQQLYEVVATDRSGNEWEGDLLFTAPAPAKPSPADQAVVTTTARSLAFPQGGTQQLLLADTFTEPVAVARSEAPTASVDQSTARDETVTVDDAVAALARTTAVLAAATADHAAQALDALAAGRGAAVWLPEVAGTLVKVMPIDIDAIEQRMRDVLDRIASPAHQSTPTAVLKTGIPRVALAVALVAAVKMLLNRTRHTRGAAPPLVFGPGAASWSWILGTTTTTTTTRRRNRRVIVRPGKT